METGFLGTPNIDAWLFVGLTAAAFATNYFGVISGTAGGLLLLVIMASFLPPAVLIPVHTCVMLGTGSTRALTMWDYVLKGTVIPFTLGCIFGAAVGARLFVSLPTSMLLGVLGLFVLAVTWLPQIGRVGSLRNRFAMLGFGVTLIGVFVSATGTLLSPFVASASPDRRNHVATLATLMATTHLAKLIAFTWIGFSIGAYLPLIAAMVVAGVLSNIAGAATLNHMREHWFRTAFKLVMTALALRLLWVALSAPS